MEQNDALEWTHIAARLRERGTFEKTATPQECGAVSRVFGDDVTCSKLRAHYTIEPLAPGRYRVVGQVEADIEQICGVSLDPMTQSIVEPFDVEFRADARNEMDLEPDFDALGEDDPEPIEQGELRIGRFVCEVVASAIDPFPRDDDAALDHTEATGDADASNPFAVLAQLKVDEQAT